MRVVIRDVNYGVSFCHVGKRGSLQGRSDFLVQVAAFRNFHKGVEADDESRLQRRPCVALNIGPALYPLLWDLFADPFTTALKPLLPKDHVSQDLRYRMGCSA